MGVRIDLPTNRPENQRKMVFTAIRFGNGESPEGDRFPMISPDFDENHGQSLSIQNGPFFQLMAAKDIMRRG